MKKLLILVLIITGISLSASAQHRYSGYRYYPRTRVVVGVGAPYYGYGYYDPFYSPFYSPVYRYPWESRLDLQIDDIRNDYQDRIWSARHDKNLRGAEKRKTIRDLKHERDLAINEARLNYYRRRP